MLNSSFVQSGKPNFGYIYGVGLFGAASMYTLLNLMSDHGIDAYRVASVLGYCLLPMVGISAISVATHLEYVRNLILSFSWLILLILGALSDTFYRCYLSFGVHILPQVYL